MKLTKKHFIITGSILFVCVVVVISLAAACGFHGFRDRGYHSAFCSKGHHAKFFGKNFSERILHRMDEKVEELNLSESQKTEYRLLREEVKQRISSAMKKRNDHFIQLQNEFNKDKPNINAAVTVIKKQLNKMPIFMADNLDLFTKFYNILDENQQNKVIETIKEKMSACNSYHRRGKS
jgi:hypothetical protein